MVRDILYLVALSVVAVFFKNQLVHVLNFVIYVHHQIANGLSVIFSNDEVGEIVQSVLALLLIPVVVGVLIGVAHFVLKQAHFPHTMPVIWGCWAVLLVAVLSQAGHHAPTQMAQVTPNPTATTIVNPKLVAQIKPAMSNKMIAQNMTKPGPLTTGAPDEKSGTTITTIQQ